MLEACNRKPFPHAPCASQNHTRSRRRVATVLPGRLQAQPNSSSSPQDPSPPQLQRPQPHSPPQLHRPQPPPPPSPTPPHQQQQKPQQRPRPLLSQQQPHPAVSAAVPLGVNLSQQDMQEIAQAWASRIRLPVFERNRLLLRSIRQATLGDPLAPELLKQDSKDFLFGEIDATEFRDRFLGLFSSSSVTSQGGSTAPGAGLQLTEQDVDTMYMELAQLLPAPEKRAALVAQLREPRMAPSARYVASATTAAVALTTPQAAPAAGPPKQQPGADQRAAQGAGQGQQQPQQPQQVVDEDGELVEIDEGIEWESEYLAPIEDQWEDFEDGSGPDVREARGWQVLDRKRMEGLVQEILRKEQQGLAQQQQQQQQQNQAPPSVGVDTSNPATAHWSWEISYDDAAHVNSASTRPARAVRGKKGGKKGKQ